MLREINLFQNIEKSVAIIWGQCLLALQSYMKGLEDFEENYDNFNMVWLLSELKKAVSGINNKVNPHITLHEAVGNVCRMKQYPGEANDHYLERFKSHIHTVELAKGGYIFCSNELIGDSPTNQDIQVEKEKIKPYCF